MNKSLIFTAIGLGLFCIAYLLINEQILVQSILYRAAASDYASALIATAAMAFQAAALLIAMITLSNRLFFCTLILLGISAATNLIYSQILNDIIDLAKFDWLLTEARHAQNAAGQFAIPATIGLTKTLLALGLFVLCRRLISLALQSHRRFLGDPRIQRLAILVLLLPSILYGLGTPGPIAAERNVYHFAIEKLAIAPPPERGVVSISLTDSEKAIEKIVWIVDESISYDAFSRLVRPGLSSFAPIDFGKTAAMANCSAPAHVALRSGVDVLNANPMIDLRKTPSIWSYAKKAGYETILIDGQVSGPPQNLLLPPEAGKIDEIQSAATGLQTDLNIAKDLNSRLKTSGKNYFYVVLRGVHFQYSDHYPVDPGAPDKSLSHQYEAAITYSKRDFFTTLLGGVDREKVAIVYTSDHGQNVKESVIPHCSTTHVKAEFSVPLLAFLPRIHSGDFPTSKDYRNSASQIFPTTLAWMGFDRSAATEAYDNMLHQPTKKFVWFGRAVIPLREGDRIEVSGSRESPAG